MSEILCLEISGDIKDLEKIAYFSSNCDFEIFRIDDRFFLKIGTLEQYKNLDDMIKQGEEIIKIINGIAEINPNLDKKIIILGLAEINKETGDIIKNLRQSFINCEVFIVTGLNDDKKEENSLNNWFRLSQADEKVKSVFILLNYGLDSFFNMYRIYEIIKNDLGKKGFKALDINIDEVNRFTGTANRPDASGELARHGYMKGKPMNSTPMTLDKASNFIYEMIYKWVHYKLKDNSS